MPFRLKAPRWVHRDLSADRRGTALGECAPFADLAEPEVLGLHDLGDGGGIVDFAHGHVFRPNTGFLVSASRRDTGDVRVAVVWIAFAAGCNHRGRDLHSARFVEAVERIFRTQDRGRPAVADRRAHWQGQRPGNLPRFEHFVDGEALAELRTLVVDRVVVVLGGYGRHLALRRAVQLHVMLGDCGVDIHEDASHAGFLGRFRRKLETVRKRHQTVEGFVASIYVDGAIENRHVLGLVRRNHLLRTYSQRDGTVA